MLFPYQLHSCQPLRQLYAAALSKEQFHEQAFWTIIPTKFKLLLTSSRELARKLHYCYRRATIIVRSNQFRFAWKEREKKSNCSERILRLWERLPPKHDHSPATTNGSSKATTWLLRDPRRPFSTFDFPIARSTKWITQPTEEGFLKRKSSVFPLKEENCDTLETIFSEQAVSALTWGCQRS